MTSYKEKAVRFLKSPLGLIFLTIIFTLIGNDLFVPPSFDTSLSSLFIKVILAVLGMLVLPLLAIKYVFKKEPREFGWILPVNIKKSLKLIGICLALNLPILFALSRMEEFQFYYRFFDDSLKFFILSGIIGSFIYYTAEEFLFRGFLFLGLYPKIGQHSFWLVSLIFAVFHFGKSYMEIVYSFGISWWLCWLTLKTKSFWPAAIIHFALALILNVLINYKG